jgi:hypothetical protein
MRRQRRIDTSFPILLGLTVLTVAVVLARDPQLVLRGLQSTGRLLGGVWMELALGFVLAGLVDVLIPHPLLSRWMGGDRLGQGILVGWAAGLVMPGGPYLVHAALEEPGAHDHAQEREPEVGTDQYPAVSPPFVGFHLKRVAEFAAGNPIAWYKEFLEQMVLPSST